MRGIKVFLLVILFIGLFELEVFPLIRGRIDGVVKDKETGNSLEGCKMTLYRKDERGDYFENRGTKTDKNGNFKFDQIKPGTYIVGCKKAGYITYHPDDIVIIARAPSELVNEVNLNEGEIKHFIIHMEKGGSIKIKVFKKDESGTFPYNQYIASISYKENDKVIGVYPHNPDEETGETFVDGLKPSDTYDFDIWAKEEVGYPIYKSQIEIKKNETTTISHTFDFIDNTGVTGIVTFKNNPVNIGEVWLFNMEEGLVARSQIGDHGEYSFKSIKPGIYRLYTGCLDPINKKHYDKWINVIIESYVMKKSDIKIQ